MILPAPRTVGLLVAGVPLAALPSIAGGLAGVWIAYLTAVLLVVGYDLVAGLSSRDLSAVGEGSTVVHIGEGGEFRVSLATRHARRDESVEVLLDLDDGWRPQPARTVAVPSDGGAEVSFPLLAERRGVYSVRAMWLRWTGPLSLVRRVRRAPVDAEVRVIPNVAAVRAAALRFFTNHEFLSGLKIERYLGDGSEFESLREFLPGHDRRTIDWKATARHRKLLCRRFQAERNHQVVIAYDTGHLMREPIDGMPRLDHAINAGLLLSYIALRTGDRVGLYSFDDGMGAYAEPQPGVHTIRRLQEICAGLDYSFQETNFTLALAQLAERLRRRSLIILITDFSDSVTAELMVENLTLLARRHLIVFLAIRDAELEGAAQRPPDSLETVGEVVAARDSIKERDVVLRRLEHCGVHCIDAPASHISTELVNRYLDIRRRELI